MATGKVARRTAVGDVAALLDSPEIAALIEAVSALRWTGRKGYGARALVGACLVKTLFALPTWTWVAALIAEHPGLQAALGETPSVWAMYRFARKLRENRPLLADCLDRIATSLQEEFPDLGRNVAIDATDLPAFSNGTAFRVAARAEAGTVLRPRCVLGAPKLRLDPQRRRVLRPQAAHGCLHQDRAAARLAGRNRATVRLPASKVWESGGAGI
jgi:hypothetical protein